MKERTRRQWRWDEVWHVAIVCTTAKGGTKQKGGTIKVYREDEQILGSTELNSS